MDDIWKSLVTGAHTLWVVHDGLSIRCSFTTFIHDYEKKRVLFTSLLAGRGFREFAHLEPELDKFAKECGCQSIQSFVIPAVAGIVGRVLPEYKITHHIMEKRINE